MGRRPGPGLNPQERGDVIPNPLALGEPSHFRAGRRSVERVASAMDLATLYISLHRKLERRIRH
ncbi:hypothetical protein [Candidatus Korarchaeum cryptofilum]|jgi:hypothetical protein|uniref:hypothetical protein n=1 Tax=Candidatus Korarchaeum cryptofilum TaxID=498846 RepID=UPI000F7764FB|nr:hypothetical protein [Candidatus Korarchaeum cryptofilum]